MIRTLSLMSLLALAACDSQVDGDHQGDALATLHGTVRNTRVNPTPNAEVVAIWETDGPVDRVGVGAVDVSGNFPTSFQLEIFEPPPAPLLSNFNGQEFGIAYIVAGEPGADYLDDGDGVLGMEENHMLVYLPEAIAADSTLGFFLHGAADAGFHVFQVKRLSEAELNLRQVCLDGLGPDPTFDEAYGICGGSVNFDDIIPAPADLDTNLEIDLVDSIEEIDAPNWT